MGIEDCMTIMRENRHKALERENQYLNDRILAIENGVTANAVGKSGLAAMKGKVVLEKSNIGWNAIANASGSLGGILVLENEKGNGGNRRIGSSSEVLWEAGKDEVNALEDEGERIRKKDGGHDEEEFGDDHTLDGHH
jgi:hypothetical protein